MDLERFLSQEKAAIVDRWLRLVLGTYPPDAAIRMKKETNEFANPVGSTMEYGIQGIYEEFLQGSDPEKINPYLDRIIRIRAVQDFTPDQALAFIFHLKKVVREMVAERQKKIAESGGSRKTEPLEVTMEDMLAFESRVDHLALLAFKVYSQCREKLYEVRLGELKMRTFRLLQRSNLLAEVPEWTQQGSEGGCTL